MTTPKLYKLFVAGCRENSTVDNFYPVLRALKVLYEAVAIMQQNASHACLDIESRSISSQAFHPFCGYTTAHLTGVRD